LVYSVSFQFNSNWMSLSPPLLISHATLHLSSWNDVLLTYSRKKLSYFYSKKEIKGDKWFKNKNEDLEFGYFIFIFSNIPASQRRPVNP
jgi:hypothetical protein